MKTEKTTFTWEGGRVSGAWHHPDEGGDYVILAHGAAGTLDTPQLKSYADKIAARGLGAVRFNFGYAEAKKKAPDKTEKLEACYRAVATEVQKKAKRLFIGGRSMGGRIGSHIVAQGFPAAGLIFLAYPLHPPGKPERIRDEHLKTISMPMLFLQGSRDPFARADLLDETIAALPTATLHRVHDGDHSHKVPGRTAVDVIDELVGATFDWLEKL